MGEFLVRRGPVHADAQDLRATFFKFGETGLVRLKLVGSSGRVRVNEKCQDNVSPPCVVFQLVEAAILVGNFELRRAVADLG